MTIGMNETLKLNSGIDSDKISKKDEFTTQDFSTISKQFTSIFNNQFNKQFESQFDYKQMFSNDSKTNDFMSNTASKMSDEKYYSHSYSKDFEQNNSTTEVKQKSSDSKESAQNQNVQDAELTAQALAMVDNTQKVQQETPVSEKTPKNNKGEEKVNETENKSENENKVLVSVKATELEKAENLLTEDILTPQIDVQLKDVKIEKLDVKTKHQSVKKDKEVNVKADVEVDKKADSAENEGAKNKVSLERLTANVVSENPGAVSELDKLLNKDIIKKVGNTLKQTVSAEEKAEGKIQVDIKNSMMNNQSFNQNSGQNNQEAQAQLKANILASHITSNAALPKNNIQMNSFVQPNQANNMLERNIFDQVMKNIQGKVSAEKSEVTMILKPENLGKVTLNIMNEKGAVSAEFKAETKEAADALNKNIQDLKETLKQQGVICANLVVKLEEPKNSENNMQFAQEQPPKDFSQGDSKNSDKHFSENQANSQTFKDELNQDIQEEQEQPIQTAKDNSLVDYRV
jgi:hypothetical protein